MKKMLIGLLLLGSQVIMQAAASSSEAASAGQHEQMIEVKVGTHSFNVPGNLLSRFEMLPGLMQDVPGQTIELPEDKVSPAALEKLIQIAALAEYLQDSDKLSLDLAAAIKTNDPEELAQLLEAADFLLMKKSIIRALVLKIPQSFYDEDELDNLVGDRGEILKRLAVEIAGSGADDYQIKQVIEDAGKPARDLLPHLAKYWWLTHNKALPELLKDIEFGVSVKDLIDHDLVPDVEYRFSLNIAILDLSNPRLHSLDGLQKIEGIECIQNLALFDNQLKRIEPGAFAGLNKLEGLGLQNNQLSRIDPKAFAGLDKLEALWLQWNQLERIESEVFAGLDKLFSLYLGNNKLKYIETGAFAGLDKLKHLALDHNQLKHINPKAFVGLDKLDLLTLDNNQLSRENIAAIKKEMPARTYVGADPQQAQSTAASSE